MVSYINVVESKNDEFVVDGFISFVHVDDNGRSTPQGISIEVLSEEDVILQKRAKALTA